MRVLYYDCFSGISGDMHLGAMLDLGVGEEYLKGELQKLNLDEFELDVKKDERRGITGTNLNVLVKEHHHHQEEDHQHHHCHRHLSDIEKIINDSALNDNVKSLSCAMFRKVAEAEAKVHGKGIDEVHFHEVGAVDSIVDTIGAAICIDYLKVDKVMCSTVEVGGGFVKCEHGTLPVPAPATTEILKGIPIRGGSVPFEATTPTGAAIVASVVDEFTDKKNFTIEKVGYGIGNKDACDVPNVLRAVIGEIDEACAGSGQEDVRVLECNIDDMNPEMYGYVMDKLFENGALDAYLTPIIMKKGRPGIKISVMCDKKHDEMLSQVLLRETSTLGVRKFKVDREKLERKFHSIDTRFGKINVKTSYMNGEAVKWKPEYEDVRKAAEENSVSMREVYEEVNRNILK